MPNGDGDKAYLKGEFYDAFVAYKIEAEADDAHAESMLGYMYAKGIGTKSNADLAFGYFILASRHGDEIAKINLATSYATGFGTKKNELSAREVLSTLSMYDIKIKDTETITKTNLISMLDRDYLLTILHPYIGQLNNQVSKPIGAENSKKLEATDSPQVESKNKHAAEQQCLELGFKFKTKQFSKCLATLNPPKQNLSSKSAPIKTEEPAMQGDGSADDITCQKYGFKVAEDGYKKCRLDIEVAANNAKAQVAQYEIQKRQYEEQVRQYQEQKNIYEARVAEMQAEKERRDTWNLLTFGAALLNGRSIGDAAPALRGQPVMPRQYYPIQAPQQPSQQEFTLNTPRGSVYCNYNGMNNQMNCR